MENAPDIRRRLGLSQGEMAKELNVNQSTLCRFEKGVTGHNDQRMIYAYRWALLLAVMDADPELKAMVEAAIKAFGEQPE